MSCEGMRVIRIAVVLQRQPIPPSRHSGATPTVRAKRGPMTGSASNPESRLIISRFPDVQLHI
jgi:hypothetical protein